VTQDPLSREVVALLARLTRTDAATVHPDQNLAFDLGVDSLMLAELIAAIETRTGGKASDEAAKDILTVRDLLALATSLRPAAPEPEARSVAPASSGPRGSFLARTTAPLVRT